MHEGQRSDGQGSTTLDVNDELSLANDIMRLGRIRHCGGGRHPLVGFISERDCFAVPWPRPWGTGAKPSRDLMKTLRIKDIMIKQVATISRRPSCARPSGS